MEVLVEGEKREWYFFFFFYVELFLKKWMKSCVREMEFSSLKTRKEERKGRLLYSEGPSTPDNFLLLSEVYFFLLLGQKVREGRSRDSSSFPASSFAPVRSWFKGREDVARWWSSGRERKKERGGGGGGRERDEARVDERKNEWKGGVSFTMWVDWSSGGLFCFWWWETFDLFTLFPSSPLSLQQQHQLEVAITQTILHPPFSSSSFLALPF